MSQIHLLIGPVGAGKSTYALELARQRRAMRLTLDQWMARLFRPDRPSTDVMRWYVQRVQRCEDQIWEVALDALQLGVEVVLEIGLIRRDDRDRFYRRVDQSNVELRVLLIDAPRDIRRARVAQRNQQGGETFSMEVPRDIFELASDLWEPPDEAERQRRRIIAPLEGLGDEG